MKKDLSQYFLILKLIMLSIISLTSKAVVTLVLGREAAVTFELIQSSIIFVLAIFSLILIFYLNKITKIVEK
ncbi:hypothetical protein ACYSNU_18215 [Enterococcus sp. LJL120]|uniref:hypothetical protein n=1 Tax=Enterococcus sp. HY326 TaxID=2971265 RepID=UPI00223EFCAE|nr:hypothetical protein [Enterococcus sp. HY326]